MKLYTHIQEVLADTKTPVSIYMTMRDKYPASVLLESSEYNSREGHYSYIALDPIASFTLKNGNLKIKEGNAVNEKELGYDFPALLREFDTFIDQFKPEEIKYPFCTSGLFGYCSFDIIKYAENEKLSTNAPEAGIPDLCYKFFSVILVFDHHTNSLFLVAHANSGPDAKKKIERVLEDMNGPVPEFPFEATGKEETNMTEEAFLSLAGKAKKHCKEGDVFQLVLSRGFKQKFFGDEFNVYRALRNINPSPYLFYFDMGDFRLFGSSPEAQLKIRKGEAEIHPIAGTYKRSGNDETDLQKASELKEDKKENSEHVMLVDLARNDLSKYCKKVEVKTFRQVQFYSHVIHLVSNVQGRIRDGVRSFEALLGTFPAGTLSGAPKYKALELINEYEPSAREFYGGCIGFLDLKGGLNHAIMIRTFLSRNNNLYFRAGAGIVIDSEEENELKEIDNKVSALRKAIGNASKFNNIAEALYRKDLTLETVAS
jgi:anthranilate synthase component I